MTRIPLSARLLRSASLLLDTRTVGQVPGSGRDSRHGSYIRGSETHDSVAGLLRHFRRRLSISRAVASGRLGVSLTAYSRWESREAIPVRDISRDLLTEFHLTLSETSMFRNAWLAEKEDKHRHRSRMASVVQRYRSHPRKSFATPEEKRSDGRLRAQRKRDRDLLRSMGLVGEDGSETPELLDLRDMILAGYPDPRITDRLRTVIPRFLSNRPKPLNFRCTSPRVDKILSPGQTEGRCTAHKGNTPCQKQPPVP